MFTCPSADSPPAWSSVQLLLLLPSKLALYRYIVFFQVTHILGFQHICSSLHVWQHQSRWANCGRRSELKWVRLTLGFAGVILLGSKNRSYEDPMDWNQHLSLVTLYDTVDTYNLDKSCIILHQHTLRTRRCRSVLGEVAFCLQDLRVSVFENI